MNQAIRHAANQAQKMTHVYALYILSWCYDAMSIKSSYDDRDSKRKRLTSIAYLARYCELERKYFTERGVL